MLAEEEVIQNPVPEGGLTVSRALSGKLNMHMPCFVIDKTEMRNSSLPSLSKPNMFILLY